MNWVRRLAFNLWYLRRPPWDSGISPPELLEFLDSHPAGRAIDLGCGTGTNVVTLARRGWQVLGVDYASRAIGLARRKIALAGVRAELRVADVTRLEAGGPFDFALDLGCFHSLDVRGRAAYLTVLDRILAPGGYWLLYAFVQTLADGPGLPASELERIGAHLRLVKRQDGFDRQRARTSAYCLFQKG